MRSLDDELENLAASGPQAEELARVITRWTAAMHRKNDKLDARAKAFGVAELLFGRADLVAELPNRVAAIPAENVMSAAKALRADSRAVLTVSAGGAK